MKNFFLDKNIDIPLYVQLYENIKKAIQNDEIEEDKLPSIRTLAAHLDVNNVTVINAYKLLEQNGYVHSIKGSGTYIKRQSLSKRIPFTEDEDMNLMLSGILPISKNGINLASVSPAPDLFPIDEFKDVLVQVLDRDRGHAFLYPEINGYRPLRESISDFIHENYNRTITPEQILITSGGQQGLDIISKSLIGQDDLIFIENPTYSGAFASFESRGARIIGIPMLNDGIDIDTLKDYLKKYNPKYIYIMTNYQSPTTYSYSEEKKAALLNLAEKYDFYIIEDDFLTDLYFQNDIKMPLISMDKNERVIYIKSFSKVFMPGVRIGFVTLPNMFLKNIMKAKHTTDISSSGYLQRAFDLYLKSGYWKVHIEKIRRFYGERYSLLLKALEPLKKYGVEFTTPNGGLSIWLKLPSDIDSLNFYKDCVENGVNLVPGNVFYLDNVKNNFIRLSFGAINNEELLQGINIIKNVLSGNLNSIENDYMPFI